MKTLTKVFGIAAGIAAIGSLASCSNDVNEPDAPMAPQSKSVLVHAPTVTAWSGDENFGGTRSTRAGEELTATAVSSDEVALAKAFFNASDNWTPASGGSLVDISSLKGWNNYFVQEVASGNRLPNDVAQFVGTNNEEVYNIAVWNMDPDDVVRLLNTDAYFNNDAKVEVDPATSPLVTDHPLKDISFEAKGYAFIGDYYEGVRSAGHSGQYDFSPNYRIMMPTGEEDVVYVALYAGASNYNNGYWNRIIKISKVDLPDAPEIEEPEGDVIVSDEILHNNEVEVNLSVMDTHRYYEDEDLVTKLSIHVRKACDVKVRIPVPYETLVEADDLDIVLNRPDLVYGEGHHASFDIDGHTVELEVNFVEANDCAGNGYGYYIEVSTKCINKEVLDYCMAQNKDGVNFEILNYYQWNVLNVDGTSQRRTPTAEEIEALRNDWLNKSTIEFGYDNGRWNAFTTVSDYPYYFINAFGEKAGERDCLVKVISNQSEGYDNYYVGPHLNGSDKNLIYVRNDIFGTERQDVAHTPHAE